ncbi:MAG: hypothetical protein ACRD6W_00895 [Nitrososphaerales archaeon]
MSDRTVRFERTIDIDSWAEKAGRSARSSGGQDLLREAWSPPQPEQKYTGWILADGVSQEVALSDRHLEELNTSKLTTVLTRWTVFHPGHQCVGECLAGLLFKPDEVSTYPAGEVNPPRHAESDRMTSKKVRSSSLSAQ